MTKTKKPAVACIHYFTMKHDALQAARSWRHFHPDIPIVIYDEVHSKKIADEFGISWTFAPTIRTLLDEYEIAIHLDADSLVTSRLEEILEGDFDVAGAKNNNFFNRAGSVNPGYTYGDIPLNEYLNIGVFAVKGERGIQFVEDWVELSKQPSSEEIPFREQGTFNILFHSGNYNTKILDEDSNPYYYGVSSAWGVGDNHWVSWKNIRLEEDQLYLRHKHIRLLHKAGAQSPDHRFNFDELFTSEIAEWVCNVTKE